MADLSKTIEAKSDQLNSDDLIGSTRTIIITNVKVKKGEDVQPISIYYEGDNNKPYKPCKSMRRLLISMWGVESSEYIGKSLKLFRDPKVMFAGAAVGGIRISHMSDIGSSQKVSLTIRRGAKADYRVEVLKVARKLSADEIEDLHQAGTKAASGGMDSYVKWGKSLTTENRAAVEHKLSEWTEMATEIDNDEGE